MSEQEQHLQHAKQHRAYQIRNKRNKQPYVQTFQLNNNLFCGDCNKEFLHKRAFDRHECKRITLRDGVEESISAAYDVVIGSPGGEAMSVDGHDVGEHGADFEEDGKYPMAMANYLQ